MGEAPAPAWVSLRVAYSFTLQSCVLGALPPALKARLPQAPLWVEMSGPAARQWSAGGEVSLLWSPLLAASPHQCDSHSLPPHGSPPNSLCWPRTQSCPHPWGHPSMHLPIPAPLHPDPQGHSPVPLLPARGPHGSMSWATLCPSLQAYLPNMVTESRHLQPWRPEPWRHLLVCALQDVRAVHLPSAAYLQKQRPSAVEDSGPVRGLPAALGTVPALPPGTSPARTSLETAFLKPLRRREEAQPRDTSCSSAPEHVRALPPQGPAGLRGTLPRETLFPKSPSPCSKLVQPGHGGREASVLLCPVVCAQGLQPPPHALAGAVPPRQASPRRPSGTP